MSAILVTGGAGYIGSHICKRLSAAGVVPVTLDNLSTGHAWAVKWGPLIEGCITDVDLARRIRKEINPAAVVHVAALSDVAASNREPQRYWSINAGGTAALRSVFRDIPWVLSSSAAIYGDGGAGAISEDDELRPINPYGATKMECERIVPAAMRLRYFNVAGADSDIGECHDPETHLVPCILEAAKSETVFTIQGDGRAVRDFVHVNDVAEANLRALRALCSGAKGHAINICGGVGHSVTDAIRVATKVTKRKIMATQTDPRPGDAARLVGSNHRAMDMLGWKPTRDLGEQVASAWQWMNR